MGKVKLQLLTTTDDTKDNVVTYTSGDTANPTAFKDVAVLASNENHKSILNKISTMFNNVRYLYKILGNTDISALGSVTQAIATLNGNVGSMKGISSSAAITTQGQYALDAREKNASVDGTLANEINKLNSNFEKCFLNTGISISDETDIKSCDDAPIGISYCDKKVVNAPFTFWATVLTVGNPNNGYFQQLALPWGVREVTTIKFRNKDNGVWTDWKTISLS